MEKEQNQETKENTRTENKDNKVINETSNNKSENNLDTKKEETEKKPEDKILELEDKLARTYAEMENQRRRFEKEREEAYEYGGFRFAKETLNLIDNAIASDVLESILITSSLFSQTIFEKNTPSLSLLIII